jgi:tryptophan synthase alpha chain
VNRIDTCFEQLRKEKRAALIPFITAGDPHVDQSLLLMHTLVEAGADIIEIGVPFSDPMADGPTIQLACERALAAGMTLPGALELVRHFRQSNQNTPIVLMGYLNPIEAMGAERFALAAREAGVDGVLSVDLTVEEADSLTPTLRAHELAPIFLVAPTTSDVRVELMGREGQGYLYYVSVKGVTGSAELDVAAVSARLSQMQSLTGLPIAVGFGIRTPEQAAAVASIADGVVVGSALVEIVAQHADDGPMMREALFTAALGLSTAIKGAGKA